MRSMYRMKATMRTNMATNEEMERHEHCNLKFRRCLNEPGMCLARFSDGFVDRWAFSGDYVFYILTLFQQLH